MKVLIACEVSGRVRDAFIARGHDAISCDLVPTWSPGPHIQGDVSELLHDGWDMMIAFPPCTYLAVSGAAWFKRPGRMELQKQGLDFVRLLLNAPISKIALENPVGVISTKIRKPDQIVQPWMFGHAETKATCLWLKGLPRLKRTEYARPPFIGGVYQYHGQTMQAMRSATYPGIARAMAEQWG